MDKKTLIIVRGIPGAGKSTFSKAKKKDLESDGYTVYHIEADDFWLNENNEYVFKPELLGVAHQTCWNRVFEAFDKGADYVIVANTFTTMKELKPYLDEANTRQLNVIIYRMDNEFQNVHNVPAETVENMKARFADVENEIKVKKSI